MQSGQLTPIHLIVEEHFHRAAPGGMGGTKGRGLQRDGEEAWVETEEACVSLTVIYYDFQFMVTSSPESFSGLMTPTLHLRTVRAAPSYLPPQNKTIHAGAGDAA